MDELENVYDDTAIFVDGLRVYSNIGIMRLVTNETAEIVRQPLENGTSVADHKIDNLTSLTMLIVLPSDDYRNVYESMRNDFIAGTIFSIKTKLRFFDSMVLEGIPTQVDGESPDKIELVASFSEYRYFPSELAALPPSKVADKTNASTVKRGSQSGTEVAAVGTPEDVSLLERILYGDGEE